MYPWIYPWIHPWISKTPTARHQRPLHWFWSSVHAPYEELVSVGPKWCKNGALMILKGSKMVHFGSEKLPKWVPGRSRDLAGRLRGAKMAYRASKDRKRRPNGPQKGLIRVPKGSPKWTKSWSKNMLKQESILKSILDRFWSLLGSQIGPIWWPKWCSKTNTHCKQQISK